MQKRRLADPHRPEEDDDGSFTHQAPQAREVVLATGQRTHVLALVHCLARRSHQPQSAVFMR
jgi:hypothetical protein